MAAVFGNKPGYQSLAQTMAGQTNDAMPPPGTPPARQAPPGYYFAENGQMLLGSAPGAAPGVPGAAPVGPAPATNDAMAPPAQAFDSGANPMGGQGWLGSQVGAETGPNGLPGITTTQVDYSTLPGLDTDFGAQGDRVRNAMFQRVSGLVNPEHERARTATAARLANQGIPEGSERWNEEMNRLDEQRAMSLERAGLDADISAGDQMAQLFGQALAARQTLGGERERGADRTYAQTLGARSQLAGERLTTRGQDVQDRASQRSADASMAAANAQAGATASGHALQAATAQAANDIARARLGLDAGNQDFTQWLLASQFARGGVPGSNMGTPIPLDVTGAAGVAQSGANAAAGQRASETGGYMDLAGLLLGSAFGGRGGKRGIA